MARYRGHKLTVEWNGERSREESASTGTCICGWEESGSTQEVVRFEYRMHLKRTVDLGRDPWVPARNLIARTYPRNI